MSPARFDVQGLTDAGFTGFIPIAELRADKNRIPATRGVYMLLRLPATMPAFLESGSGGYFKGKNPNVAVTELLQKWVEDAQVVYIGKAGDPGKAATLRSRLWQYLRFGSGANVGHWGGRYIWQLSDCEELLVAWKALPEGMPSQAESELIARFRDQHGARPFANLVK